MADVVCFWNAHDRRIDRHVPDLRASVCRAHAGECLPNLVYLPRMRRGPSAAARRLLCVLLLWVGPLPARSRTAHNYFATGSLVSADRRITVMASAGCNTQMHVARKRSSQAARRVVAEG